MVLALTCLIGWPLVGFMVGSVTGDPTAWHEDRQIVRLCTELTWLLALPCLLRVVVQGPIWLAGNSGAIDADTAVASLGVLKIAMGWPLQLGRARGDGVGAGARPHAGATRARLTGARLSPAWALGASSRSSSSSTSAGTTNSSSSPASIGCSASGT